MFVSDALGFRVSVESLNVLLCVLFLCVVSEV